MAKQRWQRSTEKAAVPPSRQETQGKRQGRWRDRGTAPKQSSASNARMFGGLFALVMVGALIVAAILVFRPFPRPHITLISAEYRTPLVDPNAFALADAVAIKSSDRLLDVRATDADSLGNAELQARVDGLSGIKPKPSFFSSQPTTAIVYVNTLGLAIWDPTQQRAVPYLLPDDFEIPSKLEGGLRQAVKVRELIDSFLRGTADRKILVFDCQRMDHHWPIGMLTNEFVESVKDEINQIEPAKRRGFYVLTSCAPGEVTWADRASSQSAFGRYFIEGISGAADQKGDRDGYITLGELERYLSQSVRDWSRRRADIQTPRLIAGDDQTPPDNVRLVALPWNVAEPNFAPAPTEPAFIDKLREGWQEYYTQRMRDPPPWRFAPQAWRLVEETLFRAESFYRAGDVNAAENELSSLGRRLADLNRTPSTAFDGEGYSLAMSKFLISQSASADPSKSSPFQPVVDDLLRGDPFDQLEKRLSDPTLLERTDPVEVHLARQLAPFATSSDRATAARELVRRSQTAESASIAAGPWAPEVTPWLRKHMEDADLGRRLQEDRFLLDGAGEVPTRTDLAVTSADTVDRLYQQILSHGESLARAMAIREQLLAELVYFERLVARRPWGSPWQDADKDFRNPLDEVFGRLNGSLAALNRKLVVDPSKKSRDEIDSEVASINQLRERCEKDRQQLMDLIAAEMRSLGETPAPPQTQIIWRRIDDLLLTPFPSHPQVASQSARTHVHLLMRSCQAVTQTGTSGEATGSQEIGNIDDVNVKERLERAVRLAQLASEFFRTGVGLAAPAEAADLSSVQSPAQLGSFIGNWWRQTRELATDKPIAPDQVDDLYQADTAQRMIEGYMTRAGLQSPTATLRRLLLAEFFADQSHRAAEDFWAAGQEQRRDYFDLVASSYLERAQSLHPAGVESYGKYAERLRELRLLESQIRLAAQPARVRFTIEDQEDVRVKPELPGGLPVGIAALSATAPAPLVRLTSPDVGQFHLEKIDPQNGPDGNADRVGALAAQLRFRGHLIRSDVPIIFTNDEIGPTILYRDDRPPVGHYSLRLADSDRNDLKLLFVLDCSTSMSDPAHQGGKSKIEELRSTLAAFAKETPANAFDVGVRWFGSEIKDRTLPATDDPRHSKLVMPIRSFNPDGFVEAIPNAPDNLGPWTPMIHGILQARRDFDNVGGNQQIVVISDGKDNWVDGRGRAGVPEIAKAYQGSGIKVHTVGFFYADTDVLGKIAETTGGRYFPITDSKKLLEELTGLANVLRFAAFNKGNDVQIPSEPAKLQTSRLEFELTPGFYDVRVTDSRGQPAADTFSIRVRPGDWHDLIYRGRRVQYDGDDLADGQIMTGPGGTTLKILWSRPADDGIELAYSLFRPNDPLWQPTATHLSVSPAGSNQTYVFHHLPPNVARMHVPTWSLRLEDWPSDARSASFAISWDEPDNPIEIDPNSPPVQLPNAPGIKLAKARYLGPPEGISAGTVVVLKAEFDPSTRPAMNDWSIVPQGKIRQARQIYNTDLGIWTGYFTLEGVDRLDKVSIYPPSSDKDATTIRTSIEITTPKLNPSRP